METNEMEKNEKETNEMETQQTPAPEQEKKGGFAQALQKYLGWFFLYISTYVLIFVGQALGIILLMIVYGILSAVIPGFMENDIVITSQLYLMFVGTWLLMLPILAIRKKNRPILKTVWKGLPGNNWKGILIGLAIGAGMNGICVLVAWLHQDIKLYFDAFRPLSFVFLFVAVLIQSSAEELLCRAYLYQKLMKLYKGNFWFCAVMNSLLFALLHLMNDGVTVLSLLNIFLTGILFSMMVYYMDSLWAAFFAHAGWNFTQNIIFGLPNSGQVVPYSVFKLDASTAINSFAYNVGFGIEGTVVADVVLLVSCVLLFLWGSKRKKAAAAQNA